MENAPSRLLIIDTAWLGDVVFTTSLIGAVKRVWPDTEVHFLLAPRGADILRFHPQVSRLWVYDKHRTQSSLISLRKFAHSLRDQRFDVILNAHPSTRSRLLTRLIGAPVSVGYGGFGSRFCFTHVFPNDLSVEPDHVERRINLLRVLKREVEPALLKVGLDPEAVQWADNLLREKGDSGSPLLALICGSAWETKRWSKDRFAEVARRWEKQRGGHVLVIGGRAESDAISFISSDAGSKAISIIAEPLPRVAALLARCQVAVGNDTGVSFLAIASGCQKVLVLYGSTQVNYTFPPPHQAITAGVPCCLPRTGHGSHQCHWGDEPWCMKQIGADRVWQETVKI